ncbi:MAG: PHP domain-containing protein, partial [Bacillota bacterium]
MQPFVHLHVHSQYSFLDGADTCSTLVARAAECGMSAIAITDHNNVSAAVELSKAAAKYGIKPIHGVEVSMSDGSHLTLLAQNPEGYANICRMLTEAHMS